MRWLVFQLRLDGVPAAYFMARLLRADCSQLGRGHKSVVVYPSMIRLQALFPRPGRGPDGDPLRYCDIPRRDGTAG
jgi:hypothetical protein